jgi:hypothetical protein
MPWIVTSPPDRTTAMIDDKAYHVLAIRTESDGDRTDFLLGAGDGKPGWVAMDRVEKTFHPIV